jgi:hypothetical protein
MPFNASDPSIGGLGLRGLPGHSGALNIGKYRSDPSTELRLLQSMAVRPVVACASRATSSHGVLGSFSTIRLTSPPYPRVCLTRYVPPSGFLTLLTAFSSTGYPALFHAGALMEFHPSELFPRSKPYRLSTVDALLPLAVPRLPTRCRRSDNRLATSAMTRHARCGTRAPHCLCQTRIRSLREGPDFRALLLEASPLQRLWWLDRRRARCSHGIDDLCG